MQFTGTYVTARSYGVLGRDFFSVQRNRSILFAVVNPRQWQTVNIRRCWYASVVFEHPTRVGFPFVLVHLYRAQVAKRLARHPVLHLQITCIIASIRLQNWLLLSLLMRWVIYEINIIFYTLTHLYKSALKCFFKYLDSTSTPTMSYSTMCVSLSSGHKVRFWLNTHRVPSKSHSWEVCGHVQFATWQGKHFVRSNDGNVPGEQRIHDFFANGRPLGSVSTAFVKINF